MFSLSYKFPQKFIWDFQVLIKYFLPSLSGKIISLFSGFCIVKHLLFKNSIIVWEAEWGWGQLHLQIPYQRKSLNKIDW